MKVHLADGTYELFRTYFGAPPATGSAGNEVGAVRGLLSTLISLLSQDDVSHVACAFDTVIESFRNDLFDGYKTGEGMAEDLLAQFPLAERATHALGIVVWPMVEHEADDALATGAHRFAARDDVDQVVICSPDKDLMQCVDGDRVVCLDRRRKIVYDEPAVIGKFGVPPRSIPDYLALVGDAADGLPGVPRFGAKSTAAILARYGDIESIPGDPAAWDVKVRGAAALAANLAAARDDALLYRRLATLVTDVPLREDLDDLEWRGARRDELNALVAELGDDDYQHDILRRVPRFRASGEDA